MPVIKTITKFFDEHQSVLYILVFIISLGLFIYLNFNATFADPDSFYHAKMALVIRDQGMITEFPWLSATTLKYNYIDHHFLYHLILIPFVSLLDPLVGLKIANIIFATLFMVVFFWFLKQLKVRGAFWYTLFLITISPFIFRLNLAKAQPLVLILLFLSLYFLFNRRYLSLLFTSFCYVWLYAGWPLIIVLAAIYLVISWFKNKHQSGWRLFKNCNRQIVRQNLTLFFCIITGTAAGLFFSPYFAKNIYFYWQQTFKIAVVNYQSLIGVGGEWYPYLLPDLLKAAPLFFILFTTALFLFIISIKRQTAVSWAFVVFSFLFFFLTLKSRRNVEYFIPVAVCFCGLAITSYFNTLRNRIFKPKIPGISVSILFFVLFITVAIFYRGIIEVKNSFAAGFSFEKFSEPAVWLKENTPPGSIVFHSDWDEFPFLFYNNSHNYYLVGLDPTFMYEYDQELHRRWVAITTGESNKDLYQTIKMIFGAQYVFVDLNSNSAFDRNLANNFYFVPVFENSEARIYQVLD